MVDSEAVQRFLDTIARMPSHVGVIWRGAQAPLEGVTTLSRPAQAALEPRYASENFTAPVLYAIASRTARSVGMQSRFPDEGEIVLMPGTRLAPIAPPTVLDGVVVQFVEEFGETADEAPPKGLPAKLEVLEAAITATLASARRAPAVTVNSPGKYVRALPAA